MGMSPRHAAPGFGRLIKAGQEDHIRLSKGRRAGKQGYLPWEKQGDGNRGGCKQGRRANNGGRAWARKVGVQAVEGQEPGGNTMGPGGGGGGASTGKREGQAIFYHLFLKAFLEIFLLKIGQSPRSPTHFRGLHRGLYHISSSR